MTDSRDSFQGDGLDVLVQDHREVEQMFTELEAMLGDPSRGDDIENTTERVIIELVRHSIAEEEYLYPTAREVLPGGDELVDLELSEHAEAEQTMKRLEKMSPDNLEFSSELRSLMMAIRDHVAEEEGELFPALRETCTREQLDDLGHKLERAKSMAPTRPHPSAPDTPPGNKLLGPGVAIVDRIRDALSGRARQS